jgi:hypothetical protein
MWYPVWTRVFLRQESQFKYHRPDVSQPWMAMTTVRTTPSYILPDAHLSPQPVNRGPWALRTVRIRY